MNNVLLAVKSSDVLAAITALQIWGEETGFEITAVAVSDRELAKATEDEKFELLIIEMDIAQTEDFRTLRKIKREGSCRHIAFCSREGDFASAREGILLGAEEYFTPPFETESFLRIFEKIRGGQASDQSNIEGYAHELVLYFEKQNAEIYEYVERIADTSFFPQILDAAVHIVFERNDWMDLYFVEDSFYSGEETDAGEQKSRFFQLYESVCRLYPRHNESLHEVILYILFNPESDLRQKYLSEQLHLNKSYLSTVFTAQTGERFVDYITYVRLTRAAWLLKNTDMKINEIAERMDYKDIPYFSRLFKKHFQITPSEYRIPDNYHFTI